MMTPPSQQADRCPYRRPFGADFDDCPTYQAVTFVAADSKNQPLGAWNTCRHLVAGNDLEQRGRFYPRCELGSREQRLQWLAKVTPAKLEAVRALQEEFDQLSLPHREQLVDARARLQSPGQATGELEGLIEAFLQTIDRFLVENAARFEDVGLPAQPLAQLIKEWLWAWGRTPDLVVPRLSERTLQAVTSPARPFLGLPAESVTIRVRRLWDQPIYTDAVLQILPTVDPQGMALIGDVDASNLAALTAALAQLGEGTGDMHLDLSGLLFCDLGGLQAIVRAAQSLEPGRRLILSGLPRQARRALDILDWAPLPNLTILEAVP